MKKYFVLISILLFGLVGNSQTSYTTVQDGDWSDPATWGGVDVSHFFAIPVPPPNWFTTGAGDTIYILHNVNMDYNVFVRDPDVLVIESTGSLNSTTNSLYNLSDGDGAFLAYGVYVNGSLNVNFLRNSARLNVAGTINISGVSATNGQIENFDVILQSGVVTADVQIDHNAGSWDIGNEAARILLTNGDFNNRADINFICSTCCIDVSNGDFNNLIGGRILTFAQGFVTASGNIDNSANLVTNWASNTSWCANNAGINLPVIAEDCTLSCIVILSVEWLHFSGALSNQGVELTWSTQSETDNAFFEIQRSIDGVDYHMIGMVEGLGYTSSITDYSFLDETPEVGSNYYRLKQVDQNGYFEFSDQIVIDRQLTNNLIVYPNPAEDVLNINTTHPVQRTELYNAHGVLIVKTASDQRQLTISHLPSGMYLLNVFTEEQFFTKTIIKK